ncbi:RNA polymerase subunit sigma [Clostridium sp. YIM B02500]|uniref:RNA polymerase subunit sigma n=1 Tax=Clostridium sp. YIM B02500 TaxID=2910681 RepID=UPI001EED9217|nr:RNA polymerase subunit sigma [Clostridium sp. YIM B02500]
MFGETRKLKIGENEYNFKMTNETILKVDDKYGNYGTVLQGIMEGKQFYTNALRLMSCSCIDKETGNDKKVERTKEFSIEELINLLKPQQLNNEIPEFVKNLYFDYIGIDTSVKKKDSKLNNKEKN